MILTGPQIRALIAEGKKRHGEESDLAKKVLGLQFQRHDEGSMGTFVDEAMNYIHVDPYDPELVGPNSVDLRLGNKLLLYSKPSIWSDKNLILDMKKLNPTEEIEIPDEGLIIAPGTLYLGRTIECIGSNAFVPIVEGRSSVGRLGIHVHVTAGFCDLGFKGTITLEIHVIHPVRIYPNIPICQAYFLKPEGAIELYKGRYMNQEEPTASRFSLSKEEFQK